MTPSFKAIAAALLVTLTPLAASAQSIGIGHTGPGSWHNGIIGGPAIGAPITPGVVGGWTPPGQGVPTPVQGQDCGAAHAQFLVGHNIQNTPVPGGARVIGPGTVVTFDYRTDRLNIAHDNHGTITRVYCG